ncbi:hypothetical protein IMY05_C0097000100 [Salix suchowensis]|nr:hypothetical protein IMY05_C0097000100 [Salix suchowensis]
MQRQDVNGLYRALIQQQMEQQAEGRSAERERAFEPHKNEPNHRLCAAFSHDHQPEEYTRMREFYPQDRRPSRTPTTLHLAAATPRLRPQPQDMGPHTAIVTATGTHVGQRAIVPIDARRLRPLHTPQLVAGLPPSPLLVFLRALAAGPLASPRRCPPPIEATGHSRLMAFLSPNRSS